MKKQWIFGALLLIGLLSTFGYRYLYKYVLIPDVTVAGFVRMGDGLGKQSVELVKILKDDFDVHFQKTRSEFCKDEVPRELFPILRNKQRPLGKVVVFEDTLARPLACFEKTFHAMRNKQIRLTYSMFETSKIPPSFVHKLHTYFDAVVVPDSYNTVAYKASGVNLPMFCLPLGIDLDPFVQAPLKKKKNTPFVFASFGSCEARKNYITTIRAFAKVFGNRSDVVLKINARRGPPPEVIAVAQEIGRLGLDNVVFSVGPVSEEQYLKNFQEIDCYVSLSKGEGFSIPPREAMALGIPCIVSDQTAQSTICQSGLVRSVPANILEKAHYETLPDDDYGDFFTVTIDDAAEAFLDMFENYESYLAKGAKARQWATAYESKRLSTLYLSLIKPKKITLGTVNEITEEGLITDSLSLYNKYLKLYPHLRP